MNNEQKDTANNRARSQTDTALTKLKHSDTKTGVSDPILPYK